ncbi:uncharacterized protein LOC126851199 [Cataglyphis hispanica]|uniref:uncharacterized protein LOC126851199 n=1 Tax=Cataglyphis hispanica TaxID=1086592 RepID=UPI00217FBA3A|nr:uncharacterized protein LOC126851199 [Cataglyphis hispanica]
MSSTMTSSHEPTTTMAETELDSDGSSCGERDTWKRLRGDSADLSIGTKKRRKQATPVRFSSSIATGAHEDAYEDEREDEDSEGKPSSRSPLLSNEHHHHQHHHHHESSLKDENLNNEFRCQHCGRFFDSDETLNVHVDGEHGGASQMTPCVAVKVEPAQQLDQSNDGPVSLLSVKNFATTWLASGSQQHVQSQTQMQSQSEEPWSGGPVNQIVTMTNHLQALSGFPGTLAQYLPLPGFPLPDPQQVPRTSLGPVPVKIFNPDAYCDMCNKEFCNKYFLKTHKANKHGIYVDSPAPSTAVDATNVFGTTSFHAANTSVKLEPPTTPPQKRFRNEESMTKRHKQKSESLMDQQSDSQQISLSQNEEDRETPRDSPGGMEALLKQDYGVEQEDATFMPAPRHLSPQSIQQARDSGFSADLLRRLGVINPEAFCEICCKEYCNKYFLRTHKMKRHGIVIQDNEKSPGNPGTAIATWHQVQTSPLNLIVTDTTPAGSESNDRIGEEHECKSCGIRFQTIDLYQEHCRKIHESEEHGTPKQEYDVESSDQRTDSISEDLQKLQTMIMQLNGLDSCKGLSCAVCGKECDSRSALRVHMATEHSVVNDEISSPQETSPTQLISTIFCTLCEKDYPSQEALRRHISEEHQPVVTNVITLSTLPPIVIASSANSTPTNQILSSQTTMTTTTTTTMTEKKMTSMTPTSSYCEICNKELCNKYFMKTHMQRMHGIEIENGAQIGGVICNICNKELCSKYFLRVHKHNTHGIVDESTSSASTSNKQESYDASGTEDSVLKQELGDLSHKYFIHFTEVCPICSRRFRSIKWLKAHLMGDHGKVGIDKWRELEQQHQETPRTSGKSVASVKNIQQTSNLKIPNGFEIIQQVKSTDCTNLGNQVLSNLFGSSSEEHQLKNYRCAYCNFATSVLPLLFLHERSHVSFQENVEGDRPLQCPICLQDFHQLELLHQHLLAKHQIPNLLSHFQHPLLNNLRSDADVKASDAKKAEQDTKDNRAECSPQIDRNISEPAKNQRQDETAVQVTAHGAYKCAQCGYATTNLNRIKKHVRKDHKLIGDPTESVIAELSKTLKDVANKQKVPACYAMPQDMNSNPDKTIMQPFLIEEQDLMQAGAESSSTKRFAPALVYLPVKSRISNALTASFTLTPA